MSAFRVKSNLVLRALNSVATYRMMGSYAVTNAYARNGFTRVALLNKNMNGVANQQTSHRMFSDVHLHQAIVQESKPAYLTDFLFSDLSISSNTKKAIADTLKIK